MKTSDRRSTHRYRLQFHPAALEEWRRLDGSIKEPLKRLLAKRLDAPRVPGAELGDDLRGCYKIKLRKQGVRLVYRVEDDALIVLVLAIDRREDNRVYRSAVKRLDATVVAMKRKERKE